MLEHSSDIVGNWGYFLNDLVMQFQRLELYALAYSAYVLTHSSFKTRVVFSGCAHSWGREHQSQHKKASSCTKRPSSSWNGVRRMLQSQYWRAFVEDEEWLAQIADLILSIPASEFPPNLHTWMQEGKSGGLSVSADDAELNTTDSKQIRPSWVVPN